MFRICLGLTLEGELLNPQLAIQGQPIALHFDGHRRWWRKDLALEIDAPLELELKAKGLGNWSLALHFPDREGIQFAGTVGPLGLHFRQILPIL